MEDKIIWAQPHEGMYDGERFDRIMFDEIGLWETPRTQHLKYKNYEMLYIVTYKITDLNRTDNYNPEIKARQTVLNDLEKVKEIGYTSHCCFNLDGSIDIKMTKETEYFGTSELIGKARKLAAGDKFPISHHDKTIEYATIKEIKGNTISCQREDGSIFSFQQDILLYHS